jgi:RimJ/RimL family protein N-acetyltransferase
MPSKVPVVETPRLRLREHRIADLDAYNALWADPVVVQYTVGVPQTPEECWSRYLRAHGHWAVAGYGYWMVEEKATGRFVGEVGFADLHRAINPSLDGMPEAGWIISPAFHGKGYATEAVRAIHEWGYEHFGPVRTCCIISPENEPSLRVAQKIGYRDIAQTIYHDHPVIVLHRDP